MKTAYVFCIIAVLAILAVFPAVYAAPTTGAPSGVTSKNITFSCTGSADPGWVEFGGAGAYAGGWGHLPWKTPNQTPAGGVVTVTQSGLPLMSGTTVYFRCCDSTGCGNYASTAMSTVTPNPPTTFRQTSENISSSHLDPAVVAGSVVEPYQWPGGGIRYEIIIGVLLFFTFVGLWLRQKEVLLPTLLGLIGSGLLFYVGTNSTGVPTEFLVLAMMLVCLGLTGVILGLFKR